MLGIVSEKLVHTLTGFRSDVQYTWHLSVRLVFVITCICQVCGLYLERCVQRFVGTRGSFWKAVGILCLKA